MNKDIWEKLGVIATFIQIVVIGGFTALVSFYTSKMSNKLDTYKAGMEESSMIEKLVIELTSDTTSNVKTDFALLSLDRYLKSSQNGELKKFDKDMLTGFAQSIILNRFFSKKKDLANEERLNEIFIESSFLQKTDSVAYNNILAIISDKEKRTNYPQKVEDIASIQPVNEVSDSTNTAALSLLFRKTCYIQYANPADKSKAEEIRKKLVEKTWYAPGIENVAGTYKSLVKYFHAEDIDLANNVKALINRPDASTILIKGYQAKVPRGQLEIWIGN